MELKILNEMKKIVLEHFDEMLKFLWSSWCYKCLRKLLRSYSKGYTGANEFRDIVNRISEPDVNEI